MTDYLKTLTTEERIMLMMANNIADTGMYADSFQQMVDYLKNQQHIQYAHEDMVMAQALQRAYDLVPYVISKSTIQARTFKDEWIRRYDSAWGIIRRMLQDKKAQELIPEEYIDDPLLREKIIKSYIFFSPELHIDIAHEIKSITNQSDEQLAQKTIWFTDAALKRSYVNL